MSTTNFTATDSSSIAVHLHDAADEDATKKEDFRPLSCFVPLYQMAITFSALMVKTGLGLLGFFFIPS